MSLKDGCMFFTEMKSMHYDSKGVILEVYIEPDNTMTVAACDCEDSVSIEIEYCPMCGRKFKHE